MGTRTILTNDFVTVRYNDDGGYVYHTFHQATGGQTFKDIFNTALDELIKQKGTKWLSDDRKNPELGQAEIEFAVTDWGPRAADAGWKFWALVVPESIAGRASMQAIVETFYNLGVRVMIFTDLESAEKWLIAQ